MLLWEILGVAFRGIFSNKLRTGLTILGIVVGIGSVVLLMAYSKGTRKDLLERFEQWGSNRMGCYINRWGSGLPIPQSEKITRADADLLRDKCGNLLKYASVVADNQTTVRYGTTTLDDHRILACEPQFQHISNYEMHLGRFFTDDEDLMQERVCVLGYMTWQSLFFNANPVGKFVEVGGKRFEVLGVMKSKGNSRWERHDEQVIMPFSTGVERMRLIDDTWVGLNFTLKEANMSEYAEERMREVLYQAHPAMPRPKDETIQEHAFDFWSAADWQAEREAAANSIEKFLLIVGALSLLIGSVGVMNIMLVTVQERTREIGLRKALGATYSSVISQFLFETLVICLIGGGVGVMIAVVASRYLAKLPEEMEVPDPILTPGAFLLALGITIMVALVAGMYPAARAASLDPIKALRQG